MSQYRHERAARLKMQPQAASPDRSSTDGSHGSPSASQDTSLECAHKGDVQWTRSLVSVVVIFLNAERFISEAVESVVAQTYGNWELLLVDDGSNDGSTEIARSYAAKFPDKIRYLEHHGHENRGMSASRNLGI